MSDSLIMHCNIPRSWAAVFIFVIGFMFWGLLHARLELDIYEVLDKNFPTSVKLAEMRDKFRDLNSLHIVFRTNEESIRADEACKVLNFFRHFSNSDARVSSWLSPWRLRQPKEEADKLWYYPFLPNPCELPAQQSVSADLEKLTDTPWAALLTDKSHKEFSVALSFRDEKENTSRQQFDTSAITDLENDLKEFLKTEKLQLNYSISGQAAFRWYFKKLFRGTQSST